MKLRHRAYRVVSQLSDRVRSACWRYFFCSFGDGSLIHGRIFVHYPEQVSVGANTTVNQGVILNARAPIKIGNNVHISYGAIITAGKLDIEQAFINRSHQAQEIVIEDGVWIGSGAIILPGVRVHKGSVVGAGSVVTKNVPSLTIVVGSPARVLKHIKP